MLLADLIWKVMTEGCFQDVLNDIASSFFTGRTRKSLNRCQLSAVCGPGLE